jgi:hypothetical protein
MGELRIWRGPKRHISMDFCVLSDHRHANGTNGAFPSVVLSAGQTALFIPEGQKPPYF